MKCCVASTLYLSRISIDDIDGQRLGTDSYQIPLLFACYYAYHLGHKSSLEDCLEQRLSSQGRPNPTAC